MKKIFTFLVLTSAALVIGGCGGGASESGPAEMAAQYRGAFQMTNVTSQCEVVSVGYNSSLGIPVQVRTRGYDELIFGSDNTGYRICGEAVWVGKFAGSMTENGGSTAGQGNVNFTLYDRLGKVLGQTGAITGTIFGNGGPVVVNLSMKNSANTDVDTTLSIGGSNVAYRNSITGSYGTLAGVYNGKATGTTMTITSGGSISGKLVQGTFTGSITAFHADTQVHDISVTVTMTNGTTQNMTGVIGPYGSLPGEFDGNGVSVLPNGDGHPGVLIAIAGAGAGAAYADVFAQK